jgi:hypothetical protein
MYVCVQVKLKTGHLEELRLDIPWKNLRSKPVIVNIQACPPRPRPACATLPNGSMLAAGWRLALRCTPRSHTGRARQGLSVVVSPNEDSSVTAEERAQRALLTKRRQVWSIGAQGRGPSGAGAGAVRG